MHYISVFLLSVFMPVTILAQINILTLEYLESTNDNINNYLEQYLDANPLSNTDFNIISSETFHAGNIATLDFNSVINTYDLDVIIFPHNLEVNNWNTQDIFPDLRNFMENKGLVIFIGSNNYEWMENESDGWLNGNVDYFDKLNLNTCVIF